MILTQERLFGIISYNPETGIFTWRERPLRPGKEKYDKGWNTDNANQQAGGPDHFGYTRIIITVNGRPHHTRAHRLAWLYMTGSWPPAEIDHINMDRNDNRFENLRLATKSDNAANRRAQSNNRCGIKGVCFDKSKNLWRAEICKNGIREIIGRFTSLEEASAARRKRAFELFGEFTNETNP